jgi:parallel beta-helix repeat protein
MTIEKYAPPLQCGAVNVQGPYWLVQQDQIELNHGYGVIAKSGGDNLHVLNSNIHHNGQMGFGGPGNGGLYDSNVVAFNNTDNVYPGWEAGGTKFNGNNITVSNNIVHDNKGQGLDTDGDGTYNVYNHNLVYNNVAAGIRYEVSRYGTIINNTVYGNTGNPQIVYTGSDHGRISGNTVIDNGSGAIGVWNIYGSRPHTQATLYVVHDVQVTNNTIWIPSTGHEVAVGFQDFGVPLQPNVFNDPSNFFDYNTYEFSSGGRNSWMWGEVPNVYLPISWTSWHNAHQDAHGRLMFNMPPPH